MRPNEDPSLNIPSSPPPTELPRPRLQRMGDIRPHPARSAGTQPALPQVPPTTQAPRPFHDFHPNPTPVPSTPQQPPVPLALPQPELPPLLEEPKKKRGSKLKMFMVGLGILLLLVVIAIGTAFVWYQQQLQSVATATGSKSATVRVVVASGSTPSTIATKLKSLGLIRSETAFLLYTKLTGTKDILKAGTYNLSASQSVAEIVNHLVAGKEDTFSMTFLPGDTLANHRKRLIQAGYGAAEVDEALAKTYDSPLFQTKPSWTGLEGYIYGETYQFDASASVSDVLDRTFTEFEKQVEAYNLVAGFKKQGLTLYEGITLASIIQREVSNTSDQKQVAQVFYSRLKQNMPLGSDVTYQYAADKLGVARDPGLDSPYNTRRYPGLPPGPIASPGLTALQAVAAPASGDYLFFLSGDDDKTYFAHTDAEHQQNITKHCQKKCSIL
jgi:UPF0755 protein